MDDKLRTLLKRVKSSEDGPEFIAYLEELKKENYESWKLSESKDIFIHQGFAIAIDTLINNFAECTKEVIKRSFTNWSS